MCKPSKITKGSSDEEQAMSDAVAVPDAKKLHEQVDRAMRHHCSRAPTGVLTTLSDNWMFFLGQDKLTRRSYCSIYHNATTDIVYRCGTLERPDWKSMGKSEHRYYAIT
jgi:hypothetical protein